MGAQARSGSVTPERSFPRGEELAPQDDGSASELTRHELSHSLGLSVLEELKALSLVLARVVLPHHPPLLDAEHHGTSALGWLPICRR